MSWPNPARLFQKLDRANQHIRNLESAWGDFLREEDPYPFTFEDDPQTGYRIYKLVSVRDVPEPISLITGDAVHNLRSTLEHMGHYLMCDSMGWLAPFPSVYFPIAVNAAQYKAGRRREIEGIGDQAIKAIDAIQPYGRGSGEILWCIHCLDIIDKHKVLLAGATKNRLHTMLPSQRAIMKERFLGLNIPQPDPASDTRLYLTESIVRKFPLEGGDVLAIVPPAEVDEHMHFRFEVAFSEPEIVKGRPIVETLHQASGLINNIIMNFIAKGLLR